MLDLTFHPSTRIHNELSQKDFYSMWSMELNSQNNESEQSQKDALALVKEVKEELSKYRKPFEKEWREYDNAYYGKQHKTGEGKKTVKNHIFKVIEGEVPILTDSMPGTQVTASREEKQEDADNLNKSIKYVYTDQNIPLILPSLVRSSCISAPGYLYAFWNPDADGGDGKVEYKQLPWESVFLDGNAQTIEQAERARIEMPMRRDSVARMWPEKRKEIMGKSGQELSMHSDDDNYEDRDIAGLDYSTGKPKKHSAKDIIKYCETWIKSYEMEDVPQEETQSELEKERQQFLNGEAPDIKSWENHNEHQAYHYQTRVEVLSPIGLPGDAPYDQVEQFVAQLLEQNPEAQDLSQILLKVKMIDNHIEEHEELKKINPDGQRPKFKDGWRVIKSVDDIILYDGGNPEEREGVGHIPLVPFYCYKDDTIYGFSEVKNIIDPQRTLNDVDNREYENLKVNANTGWIADHEAEVDENKLTNAPGIVVKKKKGTEVRRLEAGQVSPQLERRKLTDEEAIEDISGINEATQGAITPGQASGVAIQKLQNQAIGRIRLKDRYLQHYSMKRLAIITAQFILNHWTQEKTLRLRSDNSKIEEFVFNPIRMSDLKYTIDISDGSMAGIDKDSLNNLYIQYFQLSQGQMTFEDLLLVSDFPKKEILLAKLKERNQQAQELEQLQAQLQELQNQNIQLKGIVSKGLLGNDEKQVFEMASKQALMNQMIQQEQQAQQEMQGNPGANAGQPENQGIL